MSLCSSICWPSGQILDLDNFWALQPVSTGCEKDKKRQVNDRAI